MKRESRSKEAWCAWPVAPLRAPETSPTALPVGLFEVATTRFVVVDTETTGRDANARIVELAAVWFDVRTGDVEPNGIRRMRINPGVKIPHMASMVHGIFDKDVVGKPFIGRVLTPFFAFLEDGPVLMHNADFDVRRLRYEADRTNSRLPGRIPVWCSLKMARKALPGRKSYALQNLIESESIRRDGAAHSASGDASATGHLVLRCMREAKMDLKDIVAQEDVL
jgi:DNA polymerase-3 subunit epsilon